MAWLAEGGGSGENESAGDKSNRHRRKTLRRLNSGGVAAHGVWLASGGEVETRRRRRLVSAESGGDNEALGGIAKWLGENGDYI